MSTTRDEATASGGNRSAAGMATNDDMELTIDNSNGQSFQNKRSSLLNDPLKPRKGRDLVWKDVQMTVPDRSVRKEVKTKTILDNVWGEVPSGQVTAIMGPSGSGKTSLLNILAGRVSSNKHISINADVRLDNYAVDPSDITVRHKIAFVAQDDSLQITATPREAIAFSARMRLPNSLTDEELETLTNTMLHELGLEKCADTIIGGALIKGVSGGERKRTSVGVELVTQPSLVFLDEPTSGLDSFNALHLCQLLGKVAKAGSSVLFTIHQPSSEIFNAFDRLLLLNSGRVMYQEELDAAGFFPEDDRALPPALTSDGKEKDLGDSNHGKNNPFTVLALTRNDSKVDISTLGEDTKTPGVGLQTKLLFARELKNLYRNTHALKTRTGMTVMISSLIGLIFFQIADSDFSDFINVQSTFGALLMALMANVFSTALPSLTAFPEERPVFLREYSTDHYSVLAYFASKLTIELFVTAMQVTVSLTITYLLCGFSGSFGIFWSGLYLMACSSTALGVLVGSSVAEPQVAIEFLPAVFMPQILFAGFFVPPESIPVWLSWISYICPLTYGVRIVLAAEFDGRCDGISGKNHCEQVLDNVNVDVDDTWWYFLVLLSLFVVFRLMALFVLKKKAEKFY